MPCEASETNIARQYTSRHLVQTCPLFRHHIECFPMSENTQTEQPSSESSPNPPGKIQSLLDLAKADKELVRPMSNDECQLFMKAHMGEMHSPVIFDQTNQKNRPELAEAVKNSESLGIFACRLHPDTRLTVSLFLFISTLCDSPGKLVMWSYTLHRMHQQYKRTLTFAEFSHEFPWGIPTEECYRVCWERQKGYKRGLKYDNGLDQAAEWV